MRLRSLAPRTRAPRPRARLARHPATTASGRPRCPTAPGGASTCSPSPGIPQGALWVGTYGQGIYRLPAGARPGSGSGSDTVPAPISWDFVQRASPSVLGAKSGTARSATAGASRPTAARTWRNWTYDQLGPEWQYVAPGRHRRPGRHHRDRHRRRTPDHHRRRRALDRGRRHRRSAGPGAGRHRAPAARQRVRAAVSAAATGVAGPRLSRGTSGCGRRRRAGAVEPRRRGRRSAGANAILIGRPR